MSLADQVALDLPVFLAVGEFGAVRDVDGRSVACNLQDEQKATHVGDGVFVSESVLYIRLVDVAARPVITQRMTIDGKLGNVVHVDEAQGMLAVRLRWFES